VRDRDDGSPRPCRLLVPAPGPGLSPELRKTGERPRGERVRDQRREERRGERLPGGGNESGLGLGGRAAGAGAYIAQPPTGGSPPQRDDPTVTGGAGGGCGVPIGPPPCLTGRGRASPCRRFCRAGPVLVPWALIAAQARPGAWHGPGTSPPAPGPDRDSAVLSWAGPVPAQRARPSWPAIVSAGKGRDFASQ